MLFRKACKKHILREKEREREIVKEIILVLLRIPFHSIPFYSIPSGKTEQNKSRIAPVFPLPTQTMARSELSENSILGKL